MTAANRRLFALPGMITAEASSADVAEAVQVMADRRRAQAEFGRELPACARALSEQAEDPESGRVGDGLEQGDLRVDVHP